MPLKKGKLGRKKCGWALKAVAKCEEFGKNGIRKSQSRVAAPRRLLTCIEEFARMPYQACIDGSMHLDVILGAILDAKIHLVSIFARAIHDECILW